MARFLPLACSISKSKGTSSSSSCSSSLEEGFSSSSMSKRTEQRRSRHDVGFPISLSIPQHSPPGIPAPPAHPHPGSASPPWLSTPGGAVTLRVLDWHSPSQEAALQGLAGQGRAAAGGLGWSLRFRVRGQFKGGQPLPLWAGEADQPTGGLVGTWDRTGPLLGGRGSRGAGWHVILSWNGEVLEKPPCGLVSGLSSAGWRLPLWTNVGPGIHSFTGQCQTVF